MAGLYFEYERKNKLDRKFEAYALYFNARSTAQNTFVTGSTAYMFDGSYRPPILGHFWTFGARAFATDIKICKDILTVNAEAAWQTGDDTSRDSEPPNLSSTRSIEGLCTEILVNYRFNPAGEGVRPIATLGYFYSSGGDDIVDGDIGFQPLFINRHFELSDRNDIYKPYYPGGGRYGNMDQLPLFNVHILKAAMSIALTEKIELGAGYLYGVTANDEGYGTGPFGQEIDLFASYAYNDYVQFSASASVFFPGRTATDLSDLLFFDTASGVKHASNDPAFSFYVQALVQF
jgi:hypothetical protein